VLDRDWSSLSGPLQNPLMHLAEAFLATLAVREDAPCNRLLSYAQPCSNASSTRNGVLMEKPLGAVDNWFEPGHQFEWYFC
jgi:mannose-6-phosphate isomerase